MNIVRTWQCGSIYNCYAVGNVHVSGSTYSSLKLYVGGFVGYNNNSDIKNSFAFGNVSSTDNNANLGGFTGGNLYSSDISNCYRHFTSGNTFGTAKTLAEMNNPSFYAALGWSSTVWNFTNVDFANSKYPTLK